MIGSSSNKCNVETNSDSFIKVAFKRFVLTTIISALFYLLVLMIQKDPITTNMTIGMVAASIFSGLLSMFIPVRNKFVFIPIPVFLITVMLYFLGST